MAEIRSSTAVLGKINHSACFIHVLLSLFFDSPFSPLKLLEELGFLIGISFLKYFPCINLCTCIIWAYVLAQYRGQLLSISMKTQIGDMGVDDKSADSFNIRIDEASGVQKVAESKEASAIVKTLEQDNGKTFSESATLGRGWPIFRVPAHVRKVDKRAYSPRIVSIGPFHHKQKALRAFDDQKKRFLIRLQNQMRRRGCEVDLKKDMKEMEEITRKCYSEDFGDIESDDFVKMMLLDGCFIVELLRLHTKSYQVLFFSRNQQPYTKKDTNIYIFRIFYIIAFPISIYFFLLLLTSLFIENIQYSPLFLLLSLTSLSFFCYYWLKDKVWLAVEVGKLSGCH